MIRSSRLMAAMLAALFAAVLATPAYATGTRRVQPRRARTARGCKAEGTKFHDLNADGKRDAGEPGLAGCRIWADYDDDGVRDTGEPYDDTDASGATRSPASSRRAAVTTARTARAKKYRLREQRPGGGTGGWTCSYPNASTSGGFATGKGGDFGCGHGPIDTSRRPRSTGKDFGNYKQAQDHRDQEARPRAATPAASTSRSTAPSVKAAAGDGGTGSTLVEPGRPPGHRDRRAPAPTSPTTRPRSPATNGQSARTHLRPGLGRTSAVGRRDRLHDRATPASARSRSTSRPTRRDRRHELRLHGLRRRVQPRRRRRQDDHARHPARRRPTR